MPDLFMLKGSKEKRKKENVFQVLVDDHEI
jgi:hypothetical protein